MKGNKKRLRKRGNRERKSKPRGKKTEESLIVRGSRVR